LLDAVARLVRIAETATEAKVLAPLGKGGQASGVYDSLAGAGGI